MSSPTPPDKKRKELSNELRMVVAFVLMGLILVATPYVYKKLGIATPQTQSAPVKSAVQTPKATPASAAEPATPRDTPPVAGAIAAAAEAEWILDTGAYRVVFSNRGAVVKSWTLRNIKDSSGKPLELVNFRGAEKAGFP
ncbi:MAG: hypothetical protein ABUS51_00420, partial [Acidobacteriota bacterium]